MNPAANIVIVETDEVVSGKLADRIELLDQGVHARVERCYSDIVVHDVVDQPQALVNLPAFKESRGRYEFDVETSAKSVDMLRARAERLGVSLVIDVRPMPNHAVSDTTEAFVETVAAVQSDSNIVKVVKLWVPTLFNKHSVTQRTVFAKLKRAIHPSLELETLAAKLIEMVKDSHARSDFAAENIDNNGFYRAGRRGIELAFCCAALTLGMLAMIPAYIAVRLESRGGGLFRQTRLGKNNVPFTCWKLRSMYKDTKQTDSHAVGESAITKVGHYIRKCKIDELPQFVNILRGDMHLVGARPCMDSLDEVIALRNKHRIFATRPGLTGLAQIRHVDTSMCNRLVATELLYAHNRSLALDLKIVLATALGFGFGDMATNKPASLAA